jgi:tape measure domain-containing protein
VAEKVEYVITLKDQGFSSTVDKANSKVNGLEGSLGKMAKLAAGAFAVNAVVDFAKDITTIGATFDSYEISLATLLKDSGKAHETFQNIKKDAANTPFDTESLVMANRALISAGSTAGDARKDVMNLANAIAAVGGSSAQLGSMAVNMQQIKNLGKASAMDIKQFAFAGINIYQLLAEATGKNVDEVKSMEVSYDLLSKALAKSAGAGGMFEGGLEKMSKSTAGQISNLEEAVTFLKVDLYNGLKPAIQSVIVSMAEMVQVFVDMIGWANDNSDSLSKVFAPVKKLIDPIINSISGIVNAMREGQTQGSMLEGVFNKIGTVLEFLEPVFSAVGEAVGNLISAVYQLGVDLKNALDNKYVAAFVYGFRAAILNMVKTVKDLLTPVGNLIGGIITFDYEKIKKGLSGLGTALVENNPVAQYKRIGQGIAEGYKTGFATKSFFGDKDKKKGGIADLTGNTPGASSAALVAGGATSMTSSASGRVSSVKPTTININIENLVRQLEIITQNIGIPKNQIASEISKVLVGAVVDSQRLAGI